MSGLVWSIVAQQGDVVDAVVTLHGERSTAPVSEVLQTIAELANQVGETSRTAVQGVTVRLPVSLTFAVEHG